jgi:hypothetical protein
MDETPERDEDDQEEPNYEVAIGGGSETEPTVGSGDPAYDAARDRAQAERLRKPIEATAAEVLTPSKPTETAEQREKRLVQKRKYNKIYRERMKAKKAAAKAAGGPAGKPGEVPFTLTTSKGLAPPLLPKSKYHRLYEAVAQLEAKTHVGCTFESNEVVRRAVPSILGHLKHAKHKGKKFQLNQEGTIVYVTRLE